MPAAVETSIPASMQLEAIVSRSSSTAEQSEVSGTTSPQTRSRPPLASSSSGVVTGWLVPCDAGDLPVGGFDKYIGIPGPTVPNDIFEKQCFSAWGTRNEAYLKLDHDDTLRNINWDQLFNISVDIPSEWLHHCCLAACAMGREDLLRLVLRKEDPAVFLKGCEIYRSRHPVELAFRQGHIHIVKILLKFCQGAMDHCCHLGELIMCRALDGHDVELLNDVLMQWTFTFQDSGSGNDQTIRLDYQSVPHTCLGGFLESSESRGLLEDLTCSVFRYVISSLPRDAVIVARLPLFLSVQDRREMITTIIKLEALVRCSHHGFEWHPAYDTAVEGIADHLIMLRDDSIYIENSDVEMYTRLINTLESHFAKIMRRPETMASLEYIKRLLPSTAMEAGLPGSTLPALDWTSLKSTSPSPRFNKSLPPSPPPEITGHYHRLLLKDDSSWKTTPPERRLLDSS
ncbi:MAG: hypothetical protein Q9221_004933 [Calogaya cf. arnoldii]